MVKIYSGSINLDKLTESKIIQGKAGRYVDVSIVVKDTIDDYGNNVQIIEGQSEDERTDKHPRVYLGNAKLVWTGQ